MTGAVLGNWTGASVDRLLAMWADGLSASQISNRLRVEFELDVSRSAVLGKLHRMKVPHRVTASAPSARRSHPRPPAPPKPPKAKPALRLISDKQSFEEPEPRAPRVIVDRSAAFAPLPGSEPKAWMERSGRQCTWPIGEGSGPDLLACCQPVKQGRWCTHHNALGTVKTTTPNELARTLRRWTA